MRFKFGTERQLSELLLSGWAADDMVFLTRYEQRGLVDQGPGPGRQDLPIAIIVAIVVERITKPIQRERLQGVPPQGDLERFTSCASQRSPPQSHAATCAFLFVSNTKNSL